MTILEEIEILNEQIKKRLQNGDARVIQSGEDRIEYGSDVQTLINRRDALLLQAQTGGRRRTFSVVPVDN